METDKTLVVTLDGENGRVTVYNPDIRDVEHDREERIEEIYRVGSYRFNITVRVLDA